MLFCFICAMNTVLNWSSGKDAALAYHMLQKEGQYSVKTLLTTINAEHDRIVMHGVREEMLDIQAEQMGLPLKKIYLPASPDHELYNSAMQQAMDELKQGGITASAFGDIHLEDLKQYRENQLKQAGFEAVFPLWKRDTSELVRLAEETGIEAVIVCVNEKYLGKEYLGRKIGTSLLTDLPAGVDPCGEYGEFHTFVYNAPYFSSPVQWKSGDIVRKVYDAKAEETTWDKGFWFMDVLPTD